MNVTNKIIAFISSLSFVDIVFLCAVVVLLIFIVTLIYFIVINDEVLNEKESLNVNSVNLDKTNDIIKEIIDEGAKEEKEEFNDEEGELIDLKTLTQKLMEKKEEKNEVDLYEKDQEEKAIISYDELLKKHNKYAINYEKEVLMDDLLVKKVDLNDLENKEVEDGIQEEVRVISYQKEEDFLKALKELNELLN